MTGQTAPVLRLSVLTMGTPLSDLAQQYLRERTAAGELAAVTVPTVKWTLRGFCRFVRDVPLHRLSSDHVEAYLASLSVRTSTVRQRFCQLRQFARWLARRRYLAVDITAGLKSPRQPRAVPRAYRRHVVDELLAVVPDALGPADRAARGPGRAPGV